MDLELQQRYANVRAAMAEHDLDALIVSRSEYTGFEGAVTYLSGFQIVHRYASSPPEADPFIVFPSEALRRGARNGADRAGVPRSPGEYMSDYARGAGWKRVGVFGLDYVMAVRDQVAIAGAGIELLPFDVEFDLARAVKSEAELESVRDSVRINERGFEIFAESYAPGKSAAEVMAAAEEWFVAEGCGRLTMNMVLTGTDSYARPEFKIARLEEALPSSCSPSLEVAGPGMHWVEVSRAIAAEEAELSNDTEADGAGVRRVRGGGEDRDEARSQLSRRPPGGLRRIPGAWLPPRPRDGPLDRDDDDRVPEDRRGRRHRAPREHGALDAPARDRSERRRLLVHAGDVAGDNRGRHSAFPTMQVFRSAG